MRSRDGLDLGPLLFRGKLGRVMPGLVWVKGCSEVSCEPELQSILPLANSLISWPCWGCIYGLHNETSTWKSVPQKWLWIYFFLNFVLKNIFFPVMCFALPGIIGRTKWRGSYPVKTVRITKVKLFWKQIFWLCLGLACDWRSYLQIICTWLKRELSGVIICTLCPRILTYWLIGSTIISF